MEDVNSSLMGDASNWAGKGGDSAGATGGNGGTEGAGGFEGIDSSVSACHVFTWRLRRASDESELFRSLGCVVLGDGVEG